MKVTNQKSNETIESPYNHEQAAAAFAQHFAKTPNHWMWFWIHKVVMDSVQKAPMKAAANFVADAFVVAIGYGLKRPMIRAHYKDRRFKMYLSRRGTVCLKSGGLVPGTNDPEGDEEYVGCWMLDGTFNPARIGEWQRGVRDTRPLRHMWTEESEFLQNLNDNAVAFLAQCSKDMDRCCYCYSALEDPRSKLLGYGPTCAKRWGLPWGELKADEKVPSFAQAWDENARQLIQAIREDPDDQLAWSVFGDWLEEKGLARCKQPNWDAVLPRT